MLRKVIVLLVVLGFSFGLMLLTTGGSHFEVRSQARFQVPQEEVWQLLVAVGSWPDWWPGMEESSLSGTLKAGNEIHLRLKGMSSKDLALLTRVRLSNELAWEGTGIFGSRAGTRFVLEPDPDGCQLMIENYVRGPQAFLARFTGKDAFAKYHQKLLESMRFTLQGRQSSNGEKD